MEGRFVEGMLVPRASPVAGSNVAGQLVGSAGLFLGCKMHAPGLQGMLKETRIS